MATAKKASKQSKGLKKSTKIAATKTLALRRG